MATNDPPTLDATTFAALVDHTLLKAQSTESEIVAVCAEACELRTASVCVNSMWVRRVASELAGTDVATCSVVGFPLGAMDRRSVAVEAANAMEGGAHEIDMVIPIGFLKAGSTEAVTGYIGAVRNVTEGGVLKLILETALLTSDEIELGCAVAVDAGADFVKTSTGFDPAGGATVEAVALMRSAVDPDIGVKASGGIRTLADVEAMLAAGASRLGMSATVAVAAELDRRH